ncbi:MAG: ABC transporter ATP-binding protein [Verrucomicrobiales bacterium]|nr:ABC transporter ATP-binding protein [Verrucomicrobiae bacterium]MCP5554972.1 ABC transporter ATP-binding protein [Akkermansiaceae bacterium]
MIQIRDLCMNYGPLVALDRLNLDIPQGEFFAFLGPNGAGKTTTIKILTGLLRPTSGTVSICGHDLGSAPLGAKRRIGFIPDVAVFYEKLSPLEFMEFIGDLFSIGRQQVREATATLFSKFSLESVATRRIEGLSHGTRQRLAIASALMHDPEVIIIDEPMVGLDPKHARIVKDELKRRSRNGTTVFLSTHLLNVAEELADRVGIISEGRLIALGTVDQIRATVSATIPEMESLESLFLQLTATPER